MKGLRVIKCAKCGTPFIGHYRRKYCDACRNPRKEFAPFTPYGVRLPMVFCMNCGKETIVRHPDDVAFCRYCGEVIWEPED